MNFPIGAFLLILIIGGCLIVGGGTYCMTKDIECSMAGIGLVVVLGLFFSFIFLFSNSSTPIKNNTYKEITIAAEDGREIFYYKGEVDVESDCWNNCIKFETEENEKYLIYYGEQDTVKIVEQKEE